MKWPQKDRSVLSHHPVCVRKTSSTSEGRSDTKTQTVLSLRVYKAEEMCCFMEKHSLFSHSEIFPNRRLFDSSPHLKPSVNLPTGSFNKSFFFFLIGCSFAPDRWEAFMRRGHTTINYKLSLNPLLCHKQGFIVDMAMQTWALLHSPDLYHCGNRQPEEDGFASNQGPARDR